MPARPDCTAEMDETTHKPSYSGDGIRIESAGGVLGALDLKGSYPTCYVRPDCGLTRFSAE